MLSLDREGGGGWWWVGVLSTGVEIQEGCSQIAEPGSAVGYLTPEVEYISVCISTDLLRGFQFPNAQVNLRGNSSSNEIISLFNHIGLPRSDHQLL